MILSIIFLLLSIIGSNNVSSTSIKWKDCENEMHCFADHTCLLVRLPGKFAQVYESSPLKGADCDAGFTVRFTNSTWKVHILVKNRYELLEAMLYVDEVPMMGCNKRKVTLKKSKLEASGKLNPVLLPQSSFGEKEISCVFRFDIAAQPTPRGVLSFRYVSGSTPSRTTLKSTLRIDFWTGLPEFCDQNDIINKLRESAAGFIKYKIPEQDQSIIDCAGQDHSSLYINKVEIKKVSQLNCTYRNNKYVFGYDWNQTRHYFDAKEKFEAFCGVPVENACKDLATPNCNGCPHREFKASDGTEPAKLECPENKWLLDGKNYRTAKMNCTNDKNNTARWILGDGETFKTAVCYDHYNCTVKSNVIVNPFGRLIPANQTATSLTCPSGTVLTAKDPLGIVYIPDKPLQCDAEGNWMENIDQLRVFNVLPGSSIYCNDPPVETTSEGGDKQAREVAAAGSHSMFAYVGGGIFAIIAATIGGIFLVRKMVAKRKLKAEKEAAAAARFITMKETEWNWQEVNNFIAAWANYLTEEKIKFIENAYSELGNKSTVTHMLTIFEHMCSNENQQTVWRPMIYFLHRLKRSFLKDKHERRSLCKYRSWIAYQGKKMLDKYGLEKTDENEPLINAYYRYLGVFLIDYGEGGKFNILFADIDGLFNNQQYAIAAPIRTAIWVSILRRDHINHDEFEPMFDTAENWCKTEMDPEPVVEWGTKLDNIYFALSHTTDQLYMNSTATQVIKAKFVPNSVVIHWFRGALEKGDKNAFFNILKFYKQFIEKVPEESAEYTEIITSLCLFDNSAMAWKSIEDHVNKIEAVRSKIDVKEYHRRANLFNSYFKKHGEEEIKAFLAVPTRAADIISADIRPIGEVITRAREAGANSD